MSPVPPPATSYRDILHGSLPKHEDVRQFPYDDATGRTLKTGDTIKGNITIGIGRNLSAVGVSESEMEMFADNDITAAEMAVRDLLDNFDALSDVRKAVMVEMAFNLGYEGLGEFHRTLQAVREGRWSDAARFMLASKWAEQVKGRAITLANAMGSDKWTK